MKKCFSLILCTLLTLNLYACGPSLELDDISEITINNHPEISLEIKEVSLKESSLNIYTINHTGGEIGSFNEQDFVLEVLKGGNWYTLVAEDISNTSEVYRFSRERELTISWKSRYGNLPSGHYRLVKYFFYLSEYETGGIEGFYLADEFEI